MIFKNELTFRQRFIAIRILRELIRLYMKNDIFKIAYAHTTPRLRLKFGLHARMTLTCGRSEFVYYFRNMELLRWARTSFQAPPYLVFIRFNTFFLR